MNFDRHYIPLILLHLIASVVTALMLLLWPTGSQSAGRSTFQFSLWRIFPATLYFALAAYLFQSPRLEHRWEMDIRPLIPFLVADVCIGLGIGILCRAPVRGAILYPIMYISLEFLAALLGII